MRAIKAKVYLMSGWADIRDWRAIYGTPVKEKAVKAKRVKDKG